MAVMMILMLPLILGAGDLGLMMPGHHSDAQFSQSQRSDSAHTKSDAQFSPSQHSDAAQTKSDAPEGDKAPANSELR